jgi:hypothetical protein
MNQWGPNIFRRLRGFPKAWFRCGSSSTSQSRFIISRLVGEEAIQNQKSVRARDAIVAKINVLPHDHPGTLEPRQLTTAEDSGGAR